MHRNTKAIIETCQKASINLRRDILEVVHLQNSRNLKNFLRGSQNKFETNLASQLNYAELNNIIMYEKTGECRDISDISYQFDYKDKKTSYIKYIVSGIDNMMNLSHGIEHIAFSISVMKRDDLPLIENILGTAICIPSQNAIIYSESDNEVFIMGDDGLSKKLKLNQSTNIGFPFVLCATDHPHPVLESLLTKRETHFVSSGSILCDAVRVLENKVDVAFHDTPDNLEHILAVRFLIRAGGGIDAFLGNSYVFGKKSIVKIMMQNFIA
jgi:fructose-1,6-bisphosphatase/inositol monophosphatase family enzyme